jgi:hypothetical protein
VTERFNDRLEPTDPAYWERLRTDSQEWAAYCQRVGMRVMGRAGTRFLEDDLTISEAVQATIDDEARLMEAHGAPKPLVAAFRRDYEEAFQYQMDMVGEWVRPLAKLSRPRKRSPKGASAPGPA